MIDGASNNACKLQQECFLLDLRKNLAKIHGVQVDDPASWWANGLLNEAHSSTLSNKTAPQKEKIQHHFLRRGEDLELQVVVAMLSASSKDFRPLEKQAPKSVICSAPTSPPPHIHHTSQ